MCKAQGDSPWNRFDLQITTCRFWKLFTIAEHLARVFLLQGFYLIPPI